jgi:hypothetical protein
MTRSVVLATIALSVTTWAFYRLVAALKQRS